MTLRQASNKLLLIQNTDRLEHTTVRTGQRHHNVSVLNSTQIRLSICTLFLTSSVWPTWNGFGDTVGRLCKQPFKWVDRTSKSTDNSVIVILAPFFTSSSRGCATVMWEGLNGKGSHEPIIKSSQLLSDTRLADRDSAYVLQPRSN